MGGKQRVTVFDQNMGICATLQGHAQITGQCRQVLGHIRAADRLGFKRTGHQRIDRYMLGKTQHHVGQLRCFLDIIVTTATAVCHIGQYRGFMTQGNGGNGNTVSRDLGEQLRIVRVCRAAVRNKENMANFRIGFQQLVMGQIQRIGIIRTLIRKEAGNNAI